MMDLTINTEREMNELLEFLHDGRLHQNVTDTLPKQFKEPKRSSPPAPNKVRPTMKRVYQMVDQDSNQSLQPMAKTMNYRDPNLSLIRAQNIKQQIMKGNIRPQFRVVPQKTPQNGVKVVNGRSSPSTESFVPYGKLYRTVLKNGKAIQTPVVNTTYDLKFKTNAWQKQRQLQVTQGTMALNGNDVSRNQILKFAVLRDARRNPSIQELREMGKLAAVASDENQNPNEAEVKAEPVDEDEVAEVVEFGYSSPDDRPLSEVIRQRNTNNSNNRANSSSEDEAMAIIDCSGNGNDLVTLDNGAEQVIDMAVNHKRERTPYSVLPRRHVCNICDKKFVRPAELERHYRIHTGEKPFKCNVCDQEFTRKCHLTKHMITHDNKQYYCTMCKFKTIRPDTFRRHLKDHNRGAEIGVCGDTELNQLAQDSTVEIVTEDQFDMNDGTERWNNMTYD